MLRGRVGLRTPAFERARIVNLRETGWTYHRITTHVEHNLTVVCRCFLQWSVEHYHSHRRPRSTVARQDRRIVRAAMATRTVSREEIRHMLHLLCHQGPLETVSIAEGNGLRVRLARLSLTPRHRQTRLLWCRKRVDRRV